MKKTTFLITLIAAAFTLFSSGNKVNQNQTVNGIIGDISFTKTFGENPTKETNEQSRLVTHLQFVEMLLRDKTKNNLTKKQKKNRENILDLLHEYWTAGIFPKNYDYPNKRVPCFIDKEGKICAVGYLIEQTAGRKVSEEINSQYKHEYLLAMNNPTIDRWIQSSGLTKEECAMIQPAYGYPIYNNYISPEYGISSSLLSGVNLSLNTINGIQIGKGSNKKVIPIIGLITGASQLTLGVYNHYSYNNFAFSPNNAKRNLSLINIGFGTSTLILSGWNLIANKKPKERSYSWNVYSFPTPNNDMGLGFSFTKRL